MSMSSVVMYTTSWCPDCRRVKSFLTQRNIAFSEINIEEHDDAEEIVIKVNKGKRKVPTFDVAGRFFACSPFDAAELASQLNIPLNP